MTGPFRIDDRLASIGFTEFFDTAWAASGQPQATPARIVRVDRKTVELFGVDGAFQAQPHPALLRQLSDDDDELAVGDWGLVEHDANGGAWLVERFAPATRLARRDGRGVRHALVNNVDRVFIVMGLDSDFNPARLERYLAVVDAGQVEAVVVLTKRDRVDDVDLKIAALAERIGSDVRLVAVNGLDRPATQASLAGWLHAGETVVLIGSSGAGKSTLTACLMTDAGDGPASPLAGAVRDSDGRGQHTTTARTLYRLESGAALIDTPGLRTLRPDIDASALDGSFGDVAALALTCRFRDCTHRSEPGCQVRDQVDPARLKNYAKLLREVERDNQTVLDRHRALAHWKVRGRAGKQAAALKRKGGA
ncbi:ribosome small subunit-dependent GTPase A [soil metagenome]